MSIIGTTYQLFNHVCSWYKNDFSFFEDIGFHLVCYRGHEGMCPLNAPAFLCILPNDQSPAALTHCDMVDLLAATLMNA